MGSVGEGLDPSRESKECVRNALFAGGGKPRPYGNCTVECNSSSRARLSGPALARSFASPAASRREEAPPLRQAVFGLVGPVGEGLDPSRESKERVRTALFAGP